jgi:hypothetical protein
VEGTKQTRRYGADGKPLIDRDAPHKGEGPAGDVDHSHDWVNGERQPGRPPKAGDPPAPRGYPKK